MGSSVQDVKLVGGHPQQARYVALSHCWGTSPLWVTTSKNQNLPHFSQLPGNFQDAITVTRMLGLQYLWIDSLCILQDSAEDWAVECQNMANIYQNAVVTISVRDNPSSSPGGFLHKLTSQSFHCRTIGDGLRISNEIHDYNVKTSPIPHGNVDKRGWILQEKLLSKRLLHFGAGTMSFQCCADVYLDSSNHSFPPANYTNEWHAVKESLDQLEYWTPRRISNYWFTIVQDYSMRGLTKSVDKLPALSGLARVFGDALKNDYLAGLWRGDLARGLCWRSQWIWEDHPTLRQMIQSTTTGDNEKGNDWIAPTWSWASCNSKVRWELTGGPDFRPRVCVQHASVVSRGFDMYGMIESSTLIVIGRLKQVLVGTTLSFDMVTGVCIGAVCFDTRTTDVDQIESPTIVERAFSEGKETRFAKVALLVVGTERWLSPDANTVYRDICLVLTPALDPDVYKRIGYVSTRRYLAPEEDTQIPTEGGKDWSIEGTYSITVFAKETEQEIRIL